MKLVLILFASILTLQIVAQKKDPLVFHSENEKADNLFREAIEFQRARRFDLAIKNLESAVKKDPKFEQAYAMLIKNYELFTKTNCRKFILKS